MPCSRTAALIRAIHRPRNCRLRCLRSRYAYCCAFITASLAMLKTLPRRPRNPLAWRMTFLCLACAVTPRLTRGMVAPLYAYGSIARTRCLSVECTPAVPRKWRLFFVVFFVRMWRLNACERLIVPPERILKRFAALRLVFILGIALTPVLAWRRVAPAEHFANLGTTSSEPLTLRGSDRLGFLRFLLRFLLDRFLHFLLALLRRQHHDQLAPFHLGKLLHHGVRIQILLDPLDQAHAEFLVGHFAAPVAQRHLRLVAFLEELDQVSQLDLVVALVGPGAEFHFFYVDLLLLELGLVSLLRLSVFELPVIHQLANRRLGKRCDFHQIDLGLFGHLQCLSDRHDADLLAVGSDQTHLGGVDLDVDTLRSFRGDVRSPC